MRHSPKTAGFTLVELIVVVSIIAILSAIVIANIQDSRARARDAERIAELEQIRLAIEVYRQTYGHYPCESASSCSGQSVNANGIVGEGSGLDTLLEAFLGKVPHDPLGPGDGTYQYYYDGKHSCPDYPNQPVAILFAKTMEKTDSANYDDTLNTCGGSIGSEGRSGGTESYNIIIGPSSG